MVKSTALNTSIHFIHCLKVSWNLDMTMHFQTLNESLYLLSCYTVLYSVGIAPRKNYFKLQSSIRFIVELRSRSFFVAVNLFKWHLRKCNSSARYYWISPEG